MKKFYCTLPILAFLFLTEAVHASNIESDPTVQIAQRITTLYNTTDIDSFDSLDQATILKVINSFQVNDDTVKINRILRQDNPAIFDQKHDVAIDKNQAVTLVQWYLGHQIKAPDVPYFYGQIHQPFHQCKLEKTQSNIDKDSTVHVLSDLTCTNADGVSQKQLDIRISPDKNAQLGWQVISLKNIPVTNTIAGLKMSDGFKTPVSYSDARYALAITLPAGKYHYASDKNHDGVIITDDNGLWLNVYGSKQKLDSNDHVNITMTQSNGQMQVTQQGTFNSEMTSDTITAGAISHNRISCEQTSCKYLSVRYPAEQNKKRQPLMQILEKSFLSK